MDEAVIRCQECQREVDEFTAAAEHWRFFYDGSELFPYCPGTYIEVPHEAVRAIATGHFAWTTTFIITGGNPLQIPLASYSPGLNPCPSVP